jgi:hypothetical protein
MMDESNTRGREYIILGPPLGAGLKMASMDFEKLLSSSLYCKLIWVQQLLVPKGGLLLILHWYHLYMVSSPCLNRHYSPCTCPGDSSIDSLSSGVSFPDL